MPETSQVVVRLAASCSCSSLEVVDRGQQFEASASVPGRRGRECDARLGNRLLDRNGDIVVLTPSG